MRILITGAAGFIGHHVVDHFLVNTDHELVLMDSLSYAGSLTRFQESTVFQEHKQRTSWVWWDLKAPFNSFVKRQIGSVDMILHLAAGTHVDNSITAPMSFVYDNVVGMAHVLEYVREHPLTRLVYFSTDEVFGPAPEGVKYREDDRHKPGNPYAATKSAAEQLCYGYANTYGLRIIVTRCMNNFGERQHVEKFIPLVIRRLLHGEEITVHADATCKHSGSRFYIHARNTADAILFLSRKGKDGDVYHIVGEREVSNEAMVLMIADIMNVDAKYKLVDYHSSRPGHDLRYALDGTKLKQLGWSVPVHFHESLERTVKWYMKHPEWLKR